MKKASLRVSVGGAVAALGLVLMFLTGLFPFGTYAFPAFAGMLLVVVVIEIGYPFALSVFAATSLLSFLIAADKEAALLYAIFFGWYPVIKALIERLKKPVICYIIKYAVFNLCMIAAFYIAIFALSIPEESFVIFGVYLPWVFLLAGNVFFFISTVFLFLNSMFVCILKIFANVRIIIDVCQ